MNIKDNYTDYADDEEKNPYDSLTIMGFCFKKFEKNIIVSSSLDVLA